MREQDLRHVFVYFQQIADAADFARQFTHTLRTLPDELRPDWAEDVIAQSIDGTHSPRRRADIIARFTDADRAVLANAKVLGEGVDLPAVDAVVFADRTASVRRIVQALGRALRKPPTVTTKTASLVVPAYIPPGADPTDLLGTPYEALWLVTAALRHHGQTIAARAPRAKNQHPARNSHTYITRRFPLRPHPRPHRDRLRPGPAGVALPRRRPAHQLARPRPRPARPPASESPPTAPSWTKSTPRAGRAHRGGARSRRPPRSSGSSWHGGDASPAPESGSRWTATVP
ncbi:DEAD/DEAH box helicase [Streptomyces ossamyceticus]|uniref:Helicase-related protein n=1 Tax=Streptomyces ossamyceticus TaxID=249581 RepID=A0ABV2VB09_9ACTN